MCILRKSPSRWEELIRLVSGEQTRSTGNPQRIRYTRKKSMLHTRACWATCFFLANEMRVDGDGISRLSIAGFRRVRSEVLARHHNHVFKEHSHVCRCNIRYRLCTAVQYMWCIPASRCTFVLFVQKRTQFCHRTVHDTHWVVLYPWKALTLYRLLRVVSSEVKTSRALLGECAGIFQIIFAL